VAKHYSDYFSIRQDWAPCMDKDEINSKPEYWLNYYPMEGFLKLLRAVIAQLNGGGRSIWLSGGYGTGKTYAALVLQKLFMDDEERVVRWLDKEWNGKKLIPDELRDVVLARRKEKTLVVFDTGSGGITSPEQFLVRMERAISQALTDANCSVPPRGELETVAARVQQEGKYFFETRDAMRASGIELPHLAKYRTASDIDKLAQDIRQSAGQALVEALRVLRTRDIYLDISAPALLAWIKEALTVNEISRMIFIWDEFSDYIEQHKAELTTMQEIAEAAQHGKFLFMPVTHMGLRAFMAEGSENARKTEGRFEVVTLSMPTNTTLQLAASAFEINDKGAWERDRSTLWREVSLLIKNSMLEKLPETSEADFKNILPIHPMTALLLQHLALSLGSNQRSVFDFLKRSENDGESEFQTFIEHGGLDITGKQFLTSDYLWKYFVEHDDVGTVSPALQNIRIEFNRWKDKGLQPDELRVFKAALLLNLVSRIAPEGNELLQPTVDNIYLIFKGDGVIGTPGSLDRIIRELEKQHCFSVVNGHIEVFQAQSGGPELDKEKEKLRGQFSSLVLETKTQDALAQRITQSYDNTRRFVTRAMSVDALSPGAVKSKDQFGKDDNRILLQFAFAKDRDEANKIDRVKDTAKNLSGYRILFVTIPGLTFCGDDANLWETYIEQCATCNLLQDKSAKSAYERQVQQIDAVWLRRVQDNARSLQIYWAKDSGSGSVNIEAQKVSWSELRTFLPGMAKYWFSALTDDISEYFLTAFGPPRSLKSWVLAGLLFDKMTSPGPWKTLVTNYQRHGVTGADAWFSENPVHALTQMRDKSLEWLNGNLEKEEPVSLCALWRDKLKKAPFGLLPVPASAFATGFALRELPNDPRHLQWTDGVSSRSLSAETLAEMIEQAVKTDGASDGSKEKTICLLSPEEKAFVENCAVMFHIQPPADATVESVLTLIAQRIEALSEKTPLWVLSGYIQAKNPANQDALCALISHLSEAVKISSKGDTTQRTNHVKEIGRLLLTDSSLALAFSDYMKSDVFYSAFKYYVDETAPALKTKAQESGDAHGAYYEAVKNSLAQTDGWLGNEGDVKKALDEVSSQYDTILVTHRITGAEGAVSYETTLRKLRAAVFDDNKVSLAVIAAKYPAFSELRDLLDGSGIGASSIARFLEANEEALGKVFFDGAHREQIHLAKTLLKDAWPEDASPEDEQAIYSKFGAWAKCDEASFKTQAQEALRVFRENQLSHRLREAWKKRTTSESPDAWSAETGIPAEFLFAEDGKEIVDIVNCPGNAVSSRQQAVLTRLCDEALVVADKETAAKRFRERVLPKRYHALEVDTGELSAWLKTHVNADPNVWLQNPALNSAVEDFIRAQYEVRHKNTIVNMVRGMTADEAKERLLKLVSANPEAGLALVEREGSGSHDL